MRTRVKICGFTRCDDALYAAYCGVDAIGLVFYTPSPRHVEIEQARRITDALPPFVTVVGLFVDAAEEEVEETLKRIPIDLLQFHGDETPDYCRSFAHPYIKAVRMRDHVDVQRVAKEHATAAGLLLDAYHPAAKGGTGSRFDWSRIPSECDRPIILAGGLTADNVRSALETVRPYGLDVSSGVESSRGIKETMKMNSFLQEVQEFDSARRTNP
jgi:phosphoribosylanthranilate isomerase